ncbi:telomere binding protein [Equine molluscum contagiosum-like virus]|nr:telomere binding protein [Equine molluscum contagiosum-like virus]
MNHFVKQVSARARKPARELAPARDARAYARVLVCFDFAQLYYNNQALFSKRENTLDHVAKSLLVLASFRYEAYVLRGLVRALLEQRAHVHDVYFVPVGWLAGAGAAPRTHAAVRVVAAAGDAPALERHARDFLAAHEVARVTVDADGDCRVPQFALDADATAPAPVAVLSFYPFDTSQVLAVVFFGRHGDTHCGLSYLAPRAQLHELAACLYAHVGELYLVNDELGSFATTRVANAAPRRFPAARCASLCEVTRAFARARFAYAEAPPVAPMPYVPKQLVAVVDLPSDAEITCTRAHGLDVVTHIDGVRLKTVLVLAKDAFVRDVPFQGVFTKRNLVWRRRYTYRVLRASFPCPELKGAPARAGRAPACQKHCFHGSDYTTRTLAHVV